MIDPRLARAQALLVAAKQYAPETTPRAAHNHEGDDSQPVLSFDLHHTITPDHGFPLQNPPFDGFKAFADTMAGRGCCLHISTASLDDPDPDVVAARRALIDAYIQAQGLPISFVCANSEATIRLDERGVEIPSNPDWNAIAREAQKRLLDTWELGSDGRYHKRTDLTPQGVDVTEWPDLSKVQPDRPRGYTTPLADIDVHRCLTPAWGSSRTAPANPAGVKFVRSLYNAGFGVQLSCPGWSPATHSTQDWMNRLAFMRQWALGEGIPFDRFVAKDDCDLWFDDKVIRFTTWAQSGPRVLAALQAAA